jgi:hypothetical protein
MEEWGLLDTDFNKIYNYSEIYNCLIRFKETMIPKLLDGSTSKKIEIIGGKKYKIIKYKNIL